MEPTYALTPADADIVFRALTYYASDALEAFVEDDESPSLDDGKHAQEAALRIQQWLVANWQSLLREVAA